MKPYLLADWPELRTPYPERITFAANKIGLSMYGEHNALKAGIGGWCALNMVHLGMHLEFPWAPHWLCALAAFFDKPKELKCWRKWIHFCWIQLKEDVMLRTGHWVHVQYDELWIMRTFDGKFMVFVDKDDIDEKEIDVKALVHYRWSTEDNGYLPYVEPVIDPTDMLRNILAYSVSGCC